MASVIDVLGVARTNALMALDEASWREDQTREEIVESYLANVWDTIIGQGGSVEEAACGQGEYLDIININGEE